MIFIGDCSFEKGMCSWSNVKRSNLDQFDWITGSGSSNRYKGPSVDHTSGTNTGILFVGWSFY